MKKVIAIIEKGNDGSFGIHAPALKNFIFGEGDTVAEAQEDFMVGYQEMIETYENDGLPIPEELRDVVFEYQYDISAIVDTTTQLVYQQTVAI